MPNERKTDIVILGLLAHEPLTGYGIKKLIDGAISFFWKGSYGSIYPALSAMEKDGLITSSEMPQGDRKRIVYSITESGRKALADWLKIPAAKNELKYETLIKLFFSGSADKDTITANIDSFARETAAKLALLKQYQETLGKIMDNSDHLCYYLTVSFGIETYEAHLRWCESAKKLLEQQNDRR